MKKPIKKPSPKNKNRKRAPKRRKKKGSGFDVKTLFVALAFGALCSVGLWRCLDDGSESLMDPVDAPKRIKPVDVGPGKTADPTVVDEDRLLNAARAQDPLEEEEPVPEPIPEENEEVADDPAEAENESDDRFIRHAVAYHFHTQIRGAPRPDAPVIGYARRGATFQVSERVAGAGCAKGWHELKPGGMFVCRDAGVIVGEEPVTFSPSPVPPDLEAPLPYRYAYALHDNTPEYWRLPTAEELTRVEAIFERITRRDSADGGIPEERPPVDESDSDSDAEAIEAAAEATDGGVVDPFALPSFVHLRMAKGFFVSVNDTVTSPEGKYTRTVRGRYVPHQRLVPAKPTAFEGVLITPHTPWPFVYVVRGGVKLLHQAVEGGPLKAGSRVGRYKRLPFLGRMVRRGQSYVRVDEKTYIPDRAAAVFDSPPFPDDLREDERWIDIDLSEQALIAFEGQTPVFATIISSGRPEFKTPTGSFRVYNKHISITMDDPEAGEEAYSIEDVPWTQYFEEGFALHAAFWHNRFGHVRSHGCINLAPADARRLFHWTGPHLPEGVHGIVATRDNPGTRIRIRPGK